MQKAKSRLSSSEVTNLVASKYITSVKTNQSEKNKSLTEKKTNKDQIIKYLSKIHLLLLGIISSLVTYKIISSIYPDNIKNFIIPNSYLPLTLSMFLSFFFIINFFVLNSKKSFFIALTIVLTIYFRLINVVFTTQVVIFLVGILITSFLINIRFHYPRKQ